MAIQRGAHRYYDFTVIFSCFSMKYSIYYEISCRILTMNMDGVGSSWRRLCSACPSTVSKFPMAFSSSPQERKIFDVSGKWNTTSPSYSLLLGLNSTRQPVG